MKYRRITVVVFSMLVGSGIAYGVGKSGGSQLEMILVSFVVAFGVSFLISASGQGGDK